MAYINDGFWQRSYLLEFRKNGSIEESFTFSVPPESEDYDYPQRINETKTFGGIVYDDYGNDTQKITLSGSTGNNDVKRIFRGNAGSDLFMSGKDEIFYLQNMLELYGKTENLSGKEVWLYPLWGGDQKGQSTGYKTFVKSYRVLIQGFSIKRSKDNPFFFRYTISMLSIDKATSSFNYSIPSLKNNPVAAIENVKEKISWYQELKDTMKNALSSWESQLGKWMNFIDTAQNLIDEINNEIEFWGYNLSGFGKAVSSELNDANNLVTSVFNAEKKIVNYSKSISMSILDIYASAEKIWKNAIDMYKYSEVIISDKENPVADEISNAFKQTSQEFVDDFHRINEQSVHVAAQIYFGVSNLPDTSETVDDTSSGNQSTTQNQNTPRIVYGSTSRTATSGDSYESIAMDYFGDPSYASLIASYNSRDTEIKEGDTVFIPILNPTEIPKNNNVLTTEKLNDNYGSDIKIDNGNIAVRNGDLDIISGSNNLNQAISNRINTTINTRIRIPGYGIKSSIGEQSFTNYLLSSIEDTVLMDPRVKTVDSVNINGAGDSLEVSITYTDINGNKSMYGGLF